MWMLSYDSAIRELKREWEAGNKNCYIELKWYGWIVAHKKIKDRINGSN